ncbi:MAG: hypothetical protein OCU12_07190 [Methanophagales archaeon]|nr:hypothetical protein [Methanophagales archaeon]
MRYVVAVGGVVAILGREILSTSKLDGKRWMQWPERPLVEVLNG